MGEAKRKTFVREAATAAVFAERIVAIGSASAAVTAFANNTAVRAVDAALLAAHAMGLVLNMTEPSAREAMFGAICQIAWSSADLMDRYGGDVELMKASADMGEVVGSG